MRIQSVTGLEILDSRGNPTVEATITLDDGQYASAMVPSGASTGEREAVELRDGDPKRFMGKGVLNAIQNIEKIISPALKGMEVLNWRALDSKMLELDGTQFKSKLGANAILGVSMAATRLGAMLQKKPLYQFLRPEGVPLSIPVPAMNIINGGSHADNNVDFQEFMIAPHTAPSYAEALRMGTEVFHNLKTVLKKKGYSTAVGDEGGFAPNLKSNEEALEVILMAIEKAGYKPGEQISICLDPATSEMWQDGKYAFNKSNQPAKTSEQMVEFWVNWARQYPIISLEDGMAENDWDGWRHLTQQLGNKIEIVGDDLFCTNPGILAKGIEAKVANSILIKLNQIGTVSETIDTILLARKAGYHTFVSHRSGETEDSYIADLVVATDSKHIKTGSACRSERVAKYNQILRIEKQLGSQAQFAGRKAFKNQ